MCEHVRVCVRVYLVVIAGFYNSYSRHIISLYVCDNDGKIFIGKLIRICCEKKLCFSRGGWVADIELVSLFFCSLYFIDLIWCRASHRDLDVHWIFLRFLLWAWKMGTCSSVAARGLASREILSDFQFTNALFLLSGNCRSARFFC